MPFWLGSVGHNYIRVLKVSNCIWMAEWKSIELKNQRLQDQIPLGVSLSLLLSLSKENSSCQHCQLCVVCEKHQWLESWVRTFWFTTLPQYGKKQEHTDSSPDILLFRILDVLKDKVNTNWFARRESVDDFKVESKKLYLMIVQE